MVGLLRPSTHEYYKNDEEKTSICAIGNINSLQGLVDVKALARESPTEYADVFVFYLVIGAFNGSYYGSIYYRTGSSPRVV